MPDQKKGDPTALGIFAYGFTLLALSLYAAGFFSFSAESIVMIAPALFFGGLFLLVASIWEYNNGNTFGATAFGTYSAFFLVFAFAHIGIKLGWFSSLIVAHQVGIMALCFIIMTLIYWIGSFKMNLVLNLALFFLLIVFILYAIPLMTLTASGTTALGAFPGCLQAAGWVGIIDSIFTMWLGAAVIINDRWVMAGKNPIIPIIPLGKK